MAIGNAVLHTLKPRIIKRRVFFNASTALTKGYGVCYDHDFGTATDANARRNKYVNLPTSANNNSFAGVVLANYDAKTGGQWIDIAEPGSFCEVYVDATVTIGDNTYVTCQIGGGGSGTFEVAFPGFMGRGTARVCQSRTGAGLILAELINGVESGLVETIVTGTGSGALPAMVGGQTLIAGGTTPSADYTATLANGTYPGMKKRFYLVATITTHDYLVTVTAGEQLDGATDLATMEFDGAADDSMLEWGGTKWRLMHNAGTGLA
jgi:hypothetical protein